MNRTPFLVGAQRPLLFAHRGLSSQAPENTPAAFQKAKEAGVPGIELDIHLCSTGELVVIHDDTTGRVADRNLSVEKTSYAELMELDIGGWFAPEFKGEHIPLLSEVFDLLGDKVYYDIEIKSRIRKNGELVERLGRLIAERRFQDRCIVSSFNPFALRDFGEICPIPTAIIYCRDKAVPWFLRSGFGQHIGRTPILKPDHKMLPEGERTVLDGKKPVLAWTVDDPETAEKLVKRGAEGIISNKADLMVGKI